LGEEGLLNVSGKILTEYLEKDAEFLRRKIVEDIVGFYGDIVTNRQKEVEWQAPISKSFSPEHTTKILAGSKGKIILTFNSTGHIVLHYSVSFLFLKILVALGLIFAVIAGSFLRMAVITILLSLIPIAVVIVCAYLDYRRWCIKYIKGLLY
jgi:uncharacterized protein YacL